MKKLDYDNKFYRLQAECNISSAQEIVPIVLDIIKDQDKDDISVIDLGCGSGNWLKVFKDYNCRVKGVDGGNIPGDVLLIDKDEFVKHDFRTRYSDNAKYSLAISLECGEHIPEQNADELVETLTELSDIVMFSAAIPHQRGKGHINEQYATYWIKLFDKYDYQVLDVIRPRIWNNNKVRPFYAQNIFLYVRRESEEYERLEYLAKQNNEQMFNVIHPGIWEQVNDYKVVRMLDHMHENRLISWIYYTFIKKHMIRREQQRRGGDIQ